MTALEDITGWVERYEQAWQSNDPVDIERLFTPDALYYTEPFQRPWRGHAEIVERWLSRKDDPGDACFEWRPLCVTEGVGVIQGTTVYADRTYSNLWVIRLDGDGRVTEFTEWWMDHASVSDDL